MKTLVAVTIAALALGFLGLVQGGRAACEQRQRQYDGQITYTEFLARQFHATPEQTAAGLRDLRETLGNRPAC